MKQSGIMPKLCVSRNSVPCRNLFDKTDALAHISEMAWTRTNRVEDLVAIGDEVDEDYQDWRKGRRCFYEGPLASSSKNQNMQKTVG